MIKKQAKLVLTPQAMKAVDNSAARSGIETYDLMVRAGEAVAATALRCFPQALRFAVLCGPGNNGGDAYIAAKALVAAGAACEVFHLVPQASLKGDAALASGAYALPSLPLEAFKPRQGDVVMDGLFGGGLDRPVPHGVASLIDIVNASGLPVLAIDLPSGVCGRTGRVLGACFKAACTVTFMTFRPGHLLMPGRAFCGVEEVFDIGIPMRLMEQEGEGVYENTPALWQDHLPAASAASHKFTRGHLGVFSGGLTSTGAARLSAMAGLKTGAGLVTIASPSEALAINAAHSTAVMVRSVNNADDVRCWIADPRLKAFVLGPGFGVGEKVLDYTDHLRERSCVLDADAISAFAHQPERLFESFADGEPHLILTPHEGEFTRLFPDLASDSALSKVEKALKAALRANAIIIYKGADTVIAAPDGRAAINTNAPPHLATAGSGDVLAGIAGGLLAQGMPAFEAAAAAVWLHGVAGQRAGEGLIAEDLLDEIRLPR